MQRIFYALTLFALCFTVGCGGVIIKGTAKTKDGTTITTGTVKFVGEKEEFQADIKSDGTFSPGKTKDGQAIPHGVYRIAISGVHNTSGQPQARMSSSNPTPLPEIQSGGLIHSKYIYPDTSGLTIDTSKTKTLDLMLDPPE